MMKMKSAAEVVKDDDLIYSEFSGANRIIVVDAEGTVLYEV